MRAPAEGGAHADGVPSRRLEARDRLGGARDVGFWRSDRERSSTAPSIAFASVSGDADTDVDHDLGEAGNLHDVGVGEAAR